MDYFVKRMMYEGLVVPRVLYGAEAWGLKEREKKNIKVIVIKCLRYMCGVTRIEMINNEEIIRGVGEQNKQSATKKNCVLRLFGHVERMDDKITANKVYNYGVQGRAKRVWIDGEKEAVTNRGLTLEQAIVTVHDTAEWRDLVNGA